eukprot:scaffold271147_cov18-Prasinocladus_malaysianus.AAC.2
MGRFLANASQHVIWVSSKPRSFSLVCTSDLIQSRFVSTHPIPSLHILSHLISSHLISSHHISRHLACWRAVSHPMPGVKHSKAMINVGDPCWLSAFRSKAEEKDNYFGVSK